MFNLGGEKIKTAVKPDIPLSDYVAYGFFEKKFYRGFEIEIELDGHDAEIFNFYPVVDGKIYTGDLGKYISTGGENEISVETIKLS